MGDRLEKIFFKICEYLCYELGYTVYANDTHRWVDSDGWYEVQFTLEKDGKDIYINTQYGDRDLEEEWTNNNGPCEISDAFYSNIVVIIGISHTFSQTLLTMVSLTHFYQMI